MGIGKKILNILLNGKSSTRVFISHGMWLSGQTGITRTCTLCLEMCISEDCLSFYRLLACFSCKIFLPKVWVPNLLVDVDLCFRDVVLNCNLVNLLSKILLMFHTLFTQSTACYFRFIPYLVISFYLFVVLILSGV